MARQQALWAHRGSEALTTRPMPWQEAPQLAAVPAALPLVRREFVPKTQNLLHPTCPPQARHWLYRHRPPEQEAAAPTLAAAVALALPPRSDQPVPPLEVVPQPEVCHRQAAVKLALPA